MRLTKAAVSIAPSTILFLLQRAYVLRMKKPEWIKLGGSSVTEEGEIHSEQIADIKAKAARELSNKNMVGHVCSIYVHSQILLMLRHSWR
jgi:hypothetical protein